MRAGELLGLRIFFLKSERRKTKKRCLTKFFFRKKIEYKLKGNRGSCFVREKKYLWPKKSRLNTK